MPGRKSLNLVLPCIACIMVSFFLAIRLFNDGSPGWKHIVTSDGRGYYAYLPALLIDQDPTFKTTAAREAKLLGDPDYKPGYLVTSGDNTLNKYFTGEALLLFPFFITGLLATWLTGGAVDGYSFFFQFFTGLGTLFYLLFGLWFLKRLLEKMKIPPAAIAITLITILFGTNLFYYSLWQPTMSHTFSFFAINGFLWFTTKTLDEWNAKRVSIMAIFLGLVCLIRPTNGIVVLLVPFMAGDRLRLRTFAVEVWKKKALVALFVFIILFLWSLQAITWHLQTGRWMLWPYLNEGFRFGNPHIAEVLFSYRKGLFIYTPLLLISIAGLAALLFRRRWLQFFSILAFLGTGTYVIASWWNWYYGDGFGLRAFIDYYGIFAILLALAFGVRDSRAMLTAWSLVAGVAILVNLVQTWQYTHQVIHPNSMNEAKFKYVFMRTDSAVVRCLGGNEELADYNINTDRPVLKLFNDFETDKPLWNRNEIIQTGSARSGKMVGYLDSLHAFSPGIEIKAGMAGKLPESFYIRGEFFVRDSTPGATNSALIVLSMDSVNGAKNWWQGFRMNDIPVVWENSWSIRRFSLMTPVMGNPDGILKIYIWNTGKEPMVIDDFRIEVFGP